MTKEEAVMEIDKVIQKVRALESNCAACAEAAQNVISNLQTEVANLREMKKWISVTERLPEQYHRVFMAGRNGGVFIGERTSGTTAVSDGHSRGFTHWMELPNAPKEDQHGTRSI